MPAPDDRGRLLNRLAELAHEDSEAAHYEFRKTIVPLLQHLAFSQDEIAETVARLDEKVPDAEFFRHFQERMREDQFWREAWRRVRLWAAYMLAVLGAYNVAKAAGMDPIKAVRALFTRDDAP